MMPTRTGQSRRPSPQMLLARLIVKLGGKPPADLAELRSRYMQREYPAAAPITRALRRRCHVVESSIGGHAVYTITPRRKASDWHVVYTHGGGFVNALVKAHWDIIESLVAATGATVTVPLYPLAPEHDHAAAFEFLERVYRSVLERVRPEHLILCGDSAGGNLALAQTLSYRDRGLPLPGQIILFAPLADASATNPEMVALEGKDVMLRLSAVRQWGQWWAGSTDLRSPLLSPLYGDLQQLPPMQVYIGSDDILLPDARLLRDRVRDAGGTISFHETPGGIHVFMGATFAPEAREVFRQIRSALGSPPERIAAEATPGEVGPLMRSPEE